VDVNSLEHLSSASLTMNEIAEVEFETNLPLFFDSYRDCRWTGSLILIDTLSNATVGAAMIVATAENEARSVARVSLIVVPGREELALRVLDALIARGDRAVSIDDALIPDASIVAVVRALELAGTIAVSARALPAATLAEIEAFSPGSVRVEEGADEEAVMQALAVRS
jgi:bifunctional enzyme CysN/CysC/sulfate adenylyltransferase subunit 1